MSSRRRERRAEHAIKRRGGDGEINIVSLIDIFAILVFYLLVNALVVEVIPKYQNIKLPDAQAKERPQEAVTVAVSASEIFVGDKVVMTTAAALGMEQRLLPQLAAALAALAPTTEELAADLAPEREVNIVADRQIPYRLLKKILATCTDAQFARISLAVSEVAAGGGV